MQNYSRVRRKAFLFTLFLIFGVIFWQAGLKTSAQKMAGLSGQVLLDGSNDSDRVAAIAANSVFVQQAKLLANDGVAQDSHGFSVAISGDTAIVGAPRNGA